MGYRYLALIDTGRQQLHRSSPQFECMIRDSGLRELHSSGPFKLFTSPGTHCLPLPDGGIAIGNLFSRDTSATGSERRPFPAGLSPSQLRKFIASNLWGEYLLLQPEHGSAADAVVTRDPSGAVPVVYSIHNGVGFVTSDISLAERCGLYRKRIDWDFIASCLSYPNVKTGSTALSGVSELLPGHSLSITGSGLVVDESWSPWHFVEVRNRQVDMVDAASSVRNAVELATRAFIPLDSSLIVELSGGIDSSIVACSMRGASTRMACCNLTTPVPGADERQYAEPVAGVLGTVLHTRTLSFEDAPMFFPPPADSVSPRTGVLQNAVSRVMRAVGTDLGATSYYSGGGGDTVFCSLANATPAADALLENGVIAGLAAVGHLSTLHHCTLWKATRLTWNKVVAPSRKACTPDSSFLSNSATCVDPVRHPWFVAPDESLPGDRSRIVDLACTQIFRDVVSRGDGWVRMPLLSQPVMEACLSVPSWMWIEGGRNRAVARAAFSNVLPARVLNRKSKATFVAYLGGIYERNKAEIREALSAGHLQGRNLVDAAALRRYMDEGTEARDQQFLRVLALCAVENWLRHQDGGNGGTSGAWSAI